MRYEKSNGQIMLLGLFWFIGTLCIVQVLLTLDITITFQMPPSTQDRVATSNEEIFSQLSSSQEDIMSLEILGPSFAHLKYNNNSSNKNPNRDWSCAISAMLNANVRINRSKLVMGLSGLGYRPYFVEGTALGFAGKRGSLVEAWPQELDKQNIWEFERKFR